MSYVVYSLCDFQWQVCKRKEAQLVAIKTTSIGFKEGIWTLFPLLLASLCPTYTAIWLKPQKDEYGSWPSSGEIDIMEARGNKKLTTAAGVSQGIDTIGATLHFGLNSSYNIWRPTHWELWVNLINIFLLWRCGPKRAMTSSVWRFLYHTQRLTTVCRTPLDEWPARRRDLYLYLAAHNTTAGFEPTIPAGERSQTHALDRSTTGIVSLLSYSIPITISS
jgi:hypothetical protein